MGQDRRRRVKPRDALGPRWLGAGTAAGDAGEAAHQQLAVLQIHDLPEQLGVHVAVELDKISDQLITGGADTGRSLRLRPR